MENIIKVQELKVGDWFMLNNGEEIRNKYKFQGQVQPKIYGATCNNEIIEVNFNEEVQKIDGFSLYLLQGGRVWD